MPPSGSSTPRRLSLPNRQGGRKVWHPLTWTSNTDQAIPMLWQMPCQEALTFSSAPSQSCLRMMPCSEHFRQHTSMTNQHSKTQLSSQMASGFSQTAMAPSASTSFEDVTSLQQSILQLHHDSASAGHLGIDKALASILRFFYWPKIAATVREYSAHVMSASTTSQQTASQLGACNHCQYQNSPGSTSAWT